MTTPQTFSNQAIAALNAGDLKAAERWAHEAFRLAPNSAAVLIAYGAVMNARGTYPAAIRAFRRLTQIEPQSSTHWMNLATSLRASGARAEAAEAYEQAARLGGWSAELLYNSALLELEGGDYELARERLRLAAAAAPLDAEIAYRYAHLCESCSETDEALEAVRHWRQWKNWTPEILAGFGALLLTLGEQFAASDILDQLRRIPLRTVELELSIISMLERTNGLAEASERLRQLELAQVEIADDLSHRWLAVRAHIASRNDELDKAIGLYRQILDEPNIASSERQDYLFPLAKALDQQGDYEAAIGAARLAHASQMEFVDQSSPVPADEAGRVMVIADFGCDVADVARWTESSPPSEQDSPVFIVAFPRSGTTLLEQMLDAHPALQTMDEQPFLQKALARLQQQGAIYPERLAEVQEHELVEARRHYWELVSTKLKLAPGQRLLDKNPLNMLRLPAIRRLFPNSPVLIAIRHPFDVMTSNFFQHYRAPAFARLCRDLPTLALGYRRAFDFWYQQQAILQPRVLEIFYESFVSDFAAQARGIADFVGLEWDEAMLEPAGHARSKAYISTPSYSQVIQPVNRKAVGRWRRYEQHLLPLHEQVAPLMQRWGYEI